MTDKKITEDTYTPTSAASVANAFLNIQDRETGDFPRIDQMKLHKLVYYAYAWWLTENDRPLFEEDIHAWPWGPVVPSIYGDFRSAGRSPITFQRAIELVSTGPEATDFEFREPPLPDEDILDYLKEVWDAHKDFTGIQLSNSTHGPGEPWSIVKERYGDLSQKPLIPINVIRTAFRKKAKK